MTSIPSNLKVELSSYSVPLFIMPATVEYALRYLPLITIKRIYSTLGDNLAVKYNNSYLPFTDDPITIVSRRSNVEISKWFFCSGVRIGTKTIRVFDTSSHRIMLTKDLRSAEAAEAVWAILENWQRGNCLRDWSQFAASTGDLDLLKWCEPKMLDDEWWTQVINTAVSSVQLSVAKYLADKYNARADGSSIMSLIERGRLSDLDAVRPFVGGHVDRTALYESALDSSDIKTLEWVYNFAGKPRSFYLKNCPDLYKKPADVIEWVFRKKIITTKTDFDVAATFSYAEIYNAILRTGFPASHLFTDYFLSIACENFNEEFIDYLIAHGVSNERFAAFAIRSDSIEILQHLHSRGYEPDAEFRAMAREQGSHAVKAWLFDISV
jgi:hypothetical protein